MDVRKTLERAGGATTTGEIEELFWNLTESLGGCAWTYADIGWLPYLTGCYEDAARSTVREDFQEAYLVHGCSLSDPCIPKAHDGPTPFFWSNLRDWQLGHASGRLPASSGAGVMRLAFDHGLPDGLVVPLRGRTPDNRPTSAALTLFLEGADTPEAADPRVLSWLPVVAQAAHVRIGEIAPERLTTDRPGGDLTPRERDILQWAAAGRTAEDTGEVLNISGRTVEKHLQTAMEKLGAAHKAHAVALAISRGLISL